jgi:hypothetical protein
MKNSRTDDFEMTLQCLMWISHWQKTTANRLPTIAN